MAILDFSVSGWHGFGSVTQVCFGISVSNFMCMSFVTVGRRLTIVSYVAFKMAALWFRKMFNCNPPIAHCHPLLWGGGILVDHWSTISSFFYLYIIINGAVSSHTFTTQLLWMSENTLNSSYCHPILKVWTWWLLRVRSWKWYTLYILWYPQCYSTTIAQNTPNIFFTNGAMVSHRSLKMISHPAVNIT